MRVLRETISGLKPVIFVLWIVAALRLVLEASTTDVNIVAMASLYTALAVMFLLAGFTGLLDALVWKRLLLGSVVLAVACWFLPNAIAYGVAQFRGWDHGRFHVDPEHVALQKRYEAEGMGSFAAYFEAEDNLGRPTTMRGPPPAETTGGKIQTALVTGAMTSIGGMVWSLALGIVFVGIPATVRRRRGA